MLSWDGPEISPDDRDRLEECRVVFVCTANRARSAVAAALLLERSRVPGLGVGSCGTSAVTGAAPLPEAVDLARMLGVDLTRHRARPLLSGALASTDLVIGFERMHIELAVEFGGVLPERAFLLLELPALLGQGAPANADRTAVGARAVVRRLVAARSDGGGAPELPDPRGQPKFVWQELGRLLDATVGRLAYSLGGGRSPVSARREG
jgi:protein-tyrosine-phosphatase